MLIFCTFIIRTLHFTSSIWPKMDCPAPPYAALKIEKGDDEGNLFEAVKDACRRLLRGWDVLTNDQIEVWACDLP